MLNVVVFSRDRPAQLDLLLRTIEKYVKIQYQITVLANASNGTVSFGYSLCQKDHPTVTFDFSEKTLGFKAASLNAIRPNNQLTMLIVDDAIFRDEISLSDPEVLRLLTDVSVESLSLRLGSHISKCYMQGSADTPPPSIRNHKFLWVGQLGDWGYLQSVDGNVYRTDDLVKLMQTAEYSNPNTLEIELNRCSIRPRPYVAAYETSKVITIPHNRVQQQFRGNRNGGGDATLLNSSYVSGGRIRMVDYSSLRNETTHVELPLDFEAAVIAK